MTTSKNQILKNIRDALKVNSALPTAPDDIDDRIKARLKSVTPEDEEGLRVQFKKELELVDGECYTVRSTDGAADIVATIMKKNNFNEIVLSGEATCKEIAASLKNLHITHALEYEDEERKTKLANIPVSLVEAQYGVADIGSVVFINEHTQTSLPHFLSECVFVVLKKEAILANFFELLPVITQEEAKHMVFVTGPSRTADIEKILVLGAHGPRRLIVILLDS